MLRYGREERGKKQIKMKLFLMFQILQLGGNIIIGEIKSGAIIITFDNLVFIVV